MSITSFTHLSCTTLSRLVILSVKQWRESAVASAEILLTIGASLVVNSWLSACRTIMTNSTGRTERKLCMVSA